MARFAVYYAPPAGSPLAEFAAHWLGRDGETGAPRQQPAVAGITPERLHAITAAPRHYAFHATLKAPFELARGMAAAELEAAVAALARRFDPFPLALELGSLGGFLALVPAGDRAAMDGLAAACVTELDALRAPLSQAELARRRQSRLTPRQDELLLRWGYPYVLDEFRCHMTLTERLTPPEHGAIRAILERLTAPFLAAPLTIGELAIFAQPVRDAPFRVLSRHPLGG